jgi:hypothetical protein
MNDDDFAKRVKSIRQAGEIRRARGGQGQLADSCPPRYAARVITAADVAEASERLSVDDSAQLAEWLEEHGSAASASAAVLSALAAEEDEHRGPRR